MLICSQVASSITSFLYLTRAITQANYPHLLFNNRTCVCVLHLCVRLRGTVAVAGLACRSRHVSI